MDNQYAEIKIAVESYLYDTLNPEQRLLIEENKREFLEALKSKKTDVEYQFSSHRLISSQYLQDYMEKKIDKTEYFSLLLEEKKWRAKAVSFLSRIEKAIIETKVSLTRG